MVERRVFEFDLSKYPKLTYWLLCEVKELQLMTEWFLYKFKIEEKFEYAIITILKPKDETSGST